MLWMLIMLGAWAADTDPSEGLALDCPTTSTETAKRFRGDGFGGTPEAAMAAARAAAYQDAAADVCAGRSGLACEAARLHIHAETSPRVRRWSEHSATPYRACQTLAVRLSELGRIDTERASIEASLHRLAEAFRSSPTAAQPVSIDAPTWDGRCPSGHYGHALQSFLAERLIAEGATVVRDAPPDVQRVRARLHRVSPRVLTITTELYRPGEPARLLGSTRIPASFFDVPEAAGRDCPTRDVRQRAADGSMVVASFSTPERSFCPGESAEVRITAIPADRDASGPALFTFSVNAAGDAVLADRAQGTQHRLPQPVTFLQGNGTPSQLFVAAMPTNTALEWQAPCRIPGFDPTEILRDDTAWESIVYTVEPTGTGRCTKHDPSWANAEAKAESLLASLPICGQRGVKHPLDPVP